MRLSTFPSLYVTRPEPVDVEWSAFRASLADRILTDAKDGVPLFSPAEWPPEAPRKTREAVIAVHFGVLDFDDIDVQALATCLATEPCEWTLYSTHSHDPDAGAHRYRLVVPFTRPAYSYEWSRLWPRLLARFANLPDKACSDPSRCFYWPSSPPSMAHHAAYETHEGPALDVDALLADAPPIGVLEAQIVHQPITLAAVKALRAKAGGASTKNPKLAQIKATLDAVIRGEPWAEDGARDTSLFECLAFLVREQPDLDPESLVAIFAPSVAATQLVDPNTHITNDNVREKIKRLQRAQVEASITAEREAAAQAEGRISRAFTRAGTPDRRTPYTPDETTEYLTLMGGPNRWIVQCGSSYYVFLAGSYYGPFGYQDAAVHARDYLSPAASSGVLVETRTLDGRVALKSIDHLVAEYGCAAERTVYSYVAPASYLDTQTGTFYEAAAPLRRIEPRYHPEIATWLRLLGGERLETWIAWLTELSVPCAALYLSGVAGAGKSLLAEGLARLWTTRGPTDLADAMHATNNESPCPLVFGDERIPTDGRGRPRTADLRALIQARSRTLRRKYLSNSTVEGAYRVILAANNMELLSGEETLTINDITAIAGRILHVDVSQQALDFIRDCDTGGWVTRDMIAQHAAWLIVHHPRDPDPPRFLVPGGDTVARHLTIGTRVGAAVTHWLVSFLLNPAKLRSGIDRNAWPPIYVRNGSLYANAAALIASWDVYPTNTEKAIATAANVGRALSSLSHKTVKDRGGKRFHVVDTPSLKAWADMTGVASAEEIDEALKREDP